MTNEEINSAEREAEEILKSAYSEVRAEECPQGAECPVHFRVDEVYTLESAKYARLITYVGEYCVITDDNYELESPGLMLRAALGRLAIADLPAKFETTVIYVGEGALGEISEKSPEERLLALRYSEKHDDWEAVKGVHETVVSGIKADLIDVSRPWVGRR